MHNLRIKFGILAILLFSVATVPITTTGDELEEDIEAAIEAGIEWLVSQQNGDGSWGPHWRKMAYTGFVLIKLQMRAYELDYESPFDPAYLYSSNIIAGWNFLFSTDGAGNPHYAKKQLLSLQDHTWGASGTVDDPDTNGNGYGIYWIDAEIYTTGIILMALEASGTPKHQNEGTIDYNGDGNTDTFKEIAQDAADWLAWAQGDLGNREGGYDYSALDNAGYWADNSNSGYAYLGLAAAEAFGCTIPAWVRTELNVWIDYIQNDPGSADDDGLAYPDGGSGYHNPTYLVNLLKTGNLIFEMTFFGDDPTVQRFQNAMDYIVRHWQDPNQDPGWGYSLDHSHYQAMFCLMKGFEFSGIDLIDLDGDGTPEHDWYEEFAQVIVDQQHVYGYWFEGKWGDEILNTVWALLTLEKVIPLVEISVDIKPGSWPNPLNLKSKGKLPVAICGTEEFDVMTIDPGTVEITIEGISAGVAPLRWSYEDVATPYTGEPGGGHAYGADGYVDLVLHFDTQEVVGTLTLTSEAGKTIPLIITGNLFMEFGGTPIQGQDFVRLSKK